MDKWKTYKREKEEETTKKEKKQKMSKWIFSIQRNRFNRLKWTVCVYILSLNGKQSVFYDHIKSKVKTIIYKIENG